ncbi:type III secretion system translocon subunit SctE [Vibrio sp. VNB-15]
MSTFMNTIAATSYVNSVDEEPSKAASQATQSASSDTVIPGQPLPGSSVSLSGLWRLVEDQMKEVANAVSGTGKENSEAKKSLIEVQKQSQISQLEERENDINEQQKAQKKKGFWGKFAMALGFIAAIVVAPFNPAMAAVMVVTMVASIVVPKVADEIMKAAGVPEETRAKVTMGLQLAIGLASMVLSFNPAKIVTKLGQATSKMASKVASTAANIASKAPVSSVTSMVSKVGELKNIVMSMKAMRPLCKMTQKASKMLDDIAEKLKDFMVNSDKASLRASRMSQVAEVGSTTASVVSAGYGIKSADIMKDLEINQAKQEELETRIQQIINMLNQAMRAISHAFESMFKTNTDHRDFNAKMISIHM